MSAKQRILDSHQDDSLAESGRTHDAREPRAASAPEVLSRKLPKLDRDVSGLPAPRTGKRSHASHH